MGIKGTEFAAKIEEAYAEKRGYIWATAGETWTETKQAALEKKYNSDPNKYADYRQSALLGKKWIGHKVDDCSGLIKDIGSKMGLKGIYHGSNSQFSRNCTKTGPIVKGQKIPVGALIFTGKEAGQHNHVGVLTTETCVTEAQGTNKGVVHTSLSNKKWTYWGLLKGIEYGFVPGEIQDDPIPETALIPTSIVLTLRTLRKGASGEEVATLQKLLMDAGEKLPKYGIDGDFGTETLKAVKSFQKKNGLTVDGIVGPKTWDKLINGSDVEWTTSDED